MNKKLLITAVAGSMLPAASYAADLSFGGEVEGGIYNDGDLTTAGVKRAEFSVSASQELDNGMTAYAHVEAEFTGKTVKKDDDNKSDLVRDNDGTLATPAGVVTPDDVRVGLKNDTWDLRFGEVGGGTYAAQVVSGSSLDSVTSYGAQNLSAGLSYSYNFGAANAKLVMNPNSDDSATGVAVMGNAAGVNYAVGFDSYSKVTTPADDSTPEVTTDVSATFFGGNYTMGNWTYGLGIYSATEDNSANADETTISFNKLMAAGSISDTLSARFEYTMLTSEVTKVAADDTKTTEETDPTRMYLNLVYSLGGGADVKFQYTSKDEDDGKDSDDEWQVEYQLNF